MEHRIVVLFSTAILLFSLLIIRLYLLTQSDYLVEAAQKQSTYKIEITQTRGGIYDCNLNRLTDTHKRNLISVLPSASSIEAVAGQVTGLQRSSILEQIKDRLPFAADSGKNKVYSQDIENFTVYDRYGDRQIAPHIIGYLDGEGNGVSGIEAAYNDFLKEAGEKVTVSYAVDAQRFPLESQQPAISGSVVPPAEGVVLTIDREMQDIARKAAEGAIEQGAVVVMDVQSGKLKAAVSIPEYSPNHLTESLSDPTAPLYNRAFAGYCVGSTFKLAVTAAALEQGIPTSFSIDCVGGTEVGGRIFYCHNRAGHRQTDMKQAVEQSCNPYFIALGQKTGAENILYMSQAMGFGSASSFAPGLESKAGTLPTLDDLTNYQELANFSFGQGKLTATPVQIASMVSSIANGGNAVIPSLIEGTTEDGETVSSPPAFASNRIMSPETAHTIRDFMINVVEEGSGTHGKPEEGGAGGKTASAQTGKYDDDGEEIVHAWFAGFFPAQQPKYAVVVLVEGGEYGGQIASPIFKRIADQIAILEQERSDTIPLA